MGFQLNKIMEEQVTRKKFLGEIGLLLLGVTIAPSLLNKFSNFTRFKMVGDNVYLDDELLIERREV